MPVDKSSVPLCVKTKRKYPRQHVVQVANAQRPRETYVVHNLQRRLLVQIFSQAIEVDVRHAWSNCSNVRLHARLVRGRTRRRGKPGNPFRILLITVLTSGAAIAHREPHRFASWRNIGKTATFGTLCTEVPSGAGSATGRRHVPKLAEDNTVCAAMVTAV